MVCAMSGINTADSSLSDTLAWVREQSSVKRRDHARAEESRSESLSDDKSQDCVQNVPPNSGPRENQRRKELDADSHPSDSVIKIEIPGNTLGKYRSTSSYARATATDASIYSKSSHSDSSLESTPSIADRIVRAGSLLQGLACAELDLASDADAVDRLRSKLNSLSKERLSKSKAATSSTQSSCESPNTTGISPNKRSLPTAHIFEPEKMQGSQRSAIKAEKRAKKEAAAAVEERRQRIFKARPLPSGIFDTPKTATHGRSSRPLSRPGTAASSSGQSVASFLSLPASLSRRNATNSENKKQTVIVSAKQRKKLARRRKLLAAIDAQVRNEMNGAIVLYDPEFADESEDLSIASDGNDMSTLQQQIARLEAQLKHNRSICARTLNQIGELEELDGCDIDRVSICLENDDGGEGNELGISHIDFDMDNTNTSFGDAPSPTSITSARTVPARRKDSLYRRQEKWVSALEHKLDDARLQQADEIMSSITGRPQIANADDFWQKAKAAHDAAAQRDREKQEKRRKESEARESFIREKAQLELGLEPEGEVEDPKCKRTSGREKKRQTEYAERLAQPRCVITPKPSGEADADGDADGHGHEKDAVQNKLDASRVEGKYSACSAYQTACGRKPLPSPATDTDLPASAINNSNKSFADMDDKEFAVIMRRLGIQSVPKAKKRNQMKKDTTTEWEASNPYACDSTGASSRFSSCRSGATAEPSTTSSDASMVSVPASTSASASASATTSMGRFVSSNAQANLLKKMSGKECENGQTSPYTATGKSENNINNSSTCAYESPDDSPGSSSDDAICRTTTDSSRSDSPDAAFPLAKSANRELPELEPYELYEQGQLPFFGQGSSEARGRFRVRDASTFIPESMRRLAGPNDESDAGVMLLVGKKYEDDSNISRIRKEYVITVLFDRRRFDEDNAKIWWKEQRHRFVDDAKEERA